MRNIGDYASASSHSDPVECAHQVLLVTKMYICFQTANSDLYFLSFSSNSRSVKMIQVLTKNNIERQQAELLKRSRRKTIARIKSVINYLLVLGAVAGGIGKF